MCLSRHGKSQERLQVIARLIHERRRGTMPHGLAQCMLWVMRETWVGVGNLHGEPGTGTADGVDARMRLVGEGWSGVAGVAGETELGVGGGKRGGGGF